jgi:hypothetical protein
MAETLTEKETETPNAYGITPEMRKEYRKKLERMIKEQGIKAAKTTEELYKHSIKDDDGEEVDEFLKMLEEERTDNNEAHREID